MLPPNSSREKRNESFRLIERRKSPAVLIRSAKIGVEAVLVSIFIDTSADCAGSTVTSGNSNCSDSGISGASGTITGSSSFSGLPTTISSSSSSAAAANTGSGIGFIIRSGSSFSGSAPRSNCSSKMSNRPRICTIFLFATSRKAESGLRETASIRHLSS